MKIDNAIGIKKASMTACRNSAASLADKDTKGIIIKNKCKEVKEKTK